MKATVNFRLDRTQLGMTLIELLISLALGLAVLIGLSSVYVAVKNAFRFQEGSGRLQEDANFALDSISRELRMAGFAGCSGIKTVTVASVTTRYPGSVLASSNPDTISGPNPLASVETGNGEVIVQPFTPLNFIRGFDGLPSAMFATGSVPVSSGSDSLFFAGGSASTVGVTVAMPAAASPLTISSNVYGWSGANTMIVSDCVSSSLFEGTVATSGGVTTIAHDGTGNATSSFTDSYLFGPAVASGVGARAGAIVMLAQWNLFYVATRSGATTPSLYRVTFNGNARSNAEEVVSNVESMQLHYGENTLGTDSSLGTSCTLPGATTCMPNLVADEWRTTAASVTDWSRVVAVRVGLMMVSAEDNLNFDVSTTPTLLGQSYAVPTGASTKRLRKEFSTTVVLRNSVAAR
ncbi:MAG TPA: PilW family protein [Polaromonas sp.]|uniref:PilW family protein n=1 Tax=Polaromonas sp. TaxID=1869339 RepID=UPI002D431E5E|nr:PilW family protein [Polaromonas sp.]HYW55700.1 PilW family protein [Polaromonas sp.]